MKMWAPWCALFFLFVSVPVQNAFGLNSLNNGTSFKAIRRLSGSIDVWVGCADKKRFSVTWQLDGTSGKAVGPRLEPVAIPMGKRRFFIARQLEAESVKAERMPNDDYKKRFHRILYIVAVILGLFGVLYIAIIRYVVGIILVVIVNEVLPHTITH